MGMGSRASVSLDGMKAPVQSGARSSNVQSLRLCGGAQVFFWIKGTPEGKSLTTAIKRHRQR